MFINKITSNFAVGSALNSEDAGIQGAVTTLINQDLAYLGLDSFYSFCVDGESLSNMMIDSFPSVELNAAPLNGDDGEPLLINSIHGYCIKVIPDEGLTPTGAVQVSVFDIGNITTLSGADHRLVAGDSLVVMTEKGWPPLGTAQIEIGEVGTLTNCKVAFALFGHSTATALGYGT